MKKTAIILFFAAFVSLSAMGQSIQEGINHLNAERLQSAKSTFEKLLAANPNNLDANYWLGQTYIAQKNITAAKSLYEKALAASNNAPLIQVGMGHIALLEGKTAEARQLFESAINASREKKGMILIFSMQLARLMWMPLRNLIKQVILIMPFQN